MKKLALSLVVAMALVPTVSAAQIASDYLNTLSQNETEMIFPITITASADAEITAEHGISLILNSEKQILWDDVSSLSATGTAVTAEKIGATITPEYLNSYKVVHIPVAVDFASGESVKISGLTMRAYNRSFDSLFLGMDINGDFTADATDVNGYKVSTDERTDHTPPYAPSDFQGTVAPNLNSVSLTWGIPADYDIVSFVLERVVNGGVTQTLFSSLYGSSYTDNNVSEGDSIVYTVYAKDQRNIGEKAEVTVVVEAAEEEVVVEEEEEVVEETPDEEVVEEEVELTQQEQETIERHAELLRLFPYYKLRYYIKCKPAGRIVPDNDSACIWAKVDAIYAQERILMELTEKEKLTGVYITSENVELMYKRRKYPEQCYQAYCEEASTPASYCSALKKALDRSAYFMGLD